MKFVQCAVGVLLLVALLVDESDAAVYRSRSGAPLPMRIRRLYNRSAMYGEYYQPEMMYIPAMTTFTADDSFSGYLDPVQSQTVPEDKPCTSCNNIPNESGPKPEPEPEPLPELEETTRVHTVEIEQQPEEESGVAIATQVPVIEEATTQTTRTKISPKKPPQPEEDDEEDDYQDWPYVMKGRKVSPHNVFFPMMFGYPGAGRSAQNGGYPGGVTAIANSFSSGKGGVATSHATAFGNAPPLNKHNQWKRRSQHDN